MKVPRSFYFSADTAQKIASKKSTAVVYLYDNLRGPCAVGFFGKADKPAFQYRYANAAKRMASVVGWIKSMDEITERKAAALTTKKLVRALPQQFLKVGDVLSSSWGYDQTNVNYYQVTALPGKWMVEIREIGCESQDTGFMSGKCAPMVDSFLDNSKPLRRVVNEYGGIKVTSCQYASKVDQVKVAGVAVGYKPTNWSAYA